jgi:hypothetical protein
MSYLKDYIGGQAAYVRARLQGTAASLNVGTVRHKLVGVLSSDVEVRLSGKGEAL